MNDRGRTQGLSLYVRPLCAYCVVVRRAAAGLGVVLEERDIAAEPRYEAELVGATSRRTVPVLRVEHPDGRVEWVPESRDIVAYLRARFRAGSAAS